MLSRLGLRRWMTLIAVNSAVALVLLSCCELVARQLESKEKTKELTMQFHPYIMYTVNLAELPRVSWSDDYTGQTIPTTMHVNNFGFADDFDFTQTPSADYLKQFGKKKNERIIALTGGSAAQGIGATSNENAIGGRLEFYLNHAQSKFHYRVINLAMPSWNAYQEFIALDLFGSQFDPDWVVVMDGTNDAATACQLGSGAGNPMLWPAMQYFLHGQSLSSKLTDSLIKHSAIFRMLTGRQYVGPPPMQDYYRDHAEKDPRFQIRAHANWSVMADQVTFYLRAERSMLRLYQNAKYLLSTQPMVALANYNLYAGAFRDGGEAHFKALKAADDSLYHTYKGRACIRGGLNRPSHAYFLAESAMALRTMAADARTSGWRDVEYANTVSLFPLDADQRQQYFIDLVHLNDRGQDLLGKFYARKILTRDGFKKEALPL